MFAFLTHQKGKFLFSAVSRLLVFVLTFSLALGPSAAQAQTIASLNLPVPGAMVGPSQAFVPVLLKGMTIHPDNPLQFDFIIDSGNTNFTQDQIKDESQRLVKYFLASMTIPKDDLWVNLSPYEKDRIIPDELGKTELGRDMLAQDYILKQLTASLMYPEKELGKAFWDKVYKQAKEKFGTTEIPVNTFNKVWILPETATVYEHGQTVYIVEAKLKVMLDNDYLAMQQETKDQRLKTKDFRSDEGKSSVVSLQSSVPSAIIKEIILPAIEKEVNEGQNFAPLRQIYHSLILAKWYKETIKNSLLSKIYIDQKKIAGVNLDDTTLKNQIYAQYMEAYKKGVFNYIKEDYDQLSNQPIPRKYFSGGIKGDVKIAKSSSPIQESTNPKYRTTVEIKAQGKEGIASKVSRAAIAALLAVTTCVGAGCGPSNSNDLGPNPVPPVHVGDLIRADNKIIQRIYNTYDIAIIDREYPFADEQLQWIEQTLQVLPEKLRKETKIIATALQETGIPDPEEAGANARGVVVEFIMVQGTSADQPFRPIIGEESSFKNALVHEIAHVYHHFAMSIDDQSRIRELFQEAGTDRDNFPSSYAMKNEYEFFAMLVDHWFFDTARMFEDAIARSLLGKSLLLKEVLFLTELFSNFGDGSSVPFYSLNVANAEPVVRELNGEIASVGIFPHISNIAFSDLLQPGGFFLENLVQHYDMDLVSTLVPNMDSSQLSDVKGLITGGDRVFVLDNQTNSISFIDTRTAERQTIKTGGVAGQSLRAKASSDGSVFALLNDQSHVLQVWSDSAGQFAEIDLGFDNFENKVAADDFTIYPDNSIFVSARVPGEGVILDRYSSDGTRFFRIYLDNTSESYQSVDILFSDSQYVLAGSVANRGGVLFNEFFTVDIAHLTYVQAEYAHTNKTLFSPRDGSIVGNLDFNNLIRLGTHYFFLGGIPYREEYVNITDLYSGKILKTYVVLLDPFSSFWFVGKVDNSLYFTDGTDLVRIDTVTDLITKFSMDTQALKDNDFTRNDQGIPVFYLVRTTAIGTKELKQISLGDLPGSSSPIYLEEKEDKGAAPGSPATSSSPVTNTKSLALATSLGLALALGSADSAAFQLVHEGVNQSHNDVELLLKLGPKEGVEGTIINIAIANGVGTITGDDLKSLVKQFKKDNPEKRDDGIYNFQSVAERTIAMRILNKIKKENAEIIFSQTLNISNPSFDKMHLYGVDTFAASDRALFGAPYAAMKAGDSLFIGFREIYSMDTQAEIEIKLKNPILTEIFRNATNEDVFLSILKETIYHESFHGKTDRLMSKGKVQGQIDRAMASYGISDDLVRLNARREIAAYLGGIYYQTYPKNTLFDLFKYSQELNPGAVPQLMKSGKIPYNMAGRVITTMLLTDFGSPPNSNFDNIMKIPDTEIKRWIEKILKDDFDIIKMPQLSIGQAIDQSRIWYRKIRGEKHATTPAVSPASSPVTEQQGIGDRVKGTKISNDERRDTSDEKDVGGIDMNAIDLEREGAGVDIQFDPAELQEIIDAGIDGFAPVIINITPLPSVLPLLGLEPQRKEEELEVSRLN